MILPSLHCLFFLHPPIQTGASAVTFLPSFSSDFHRLSLRIFVLPIGQNRHGLHPLCSGWKAEEEGREETRVSRPFFPLFFTLLFFITISFFIFPSRLQTFVTLPRKPLLHKPSTPFPPFICTTSKRIQIHPTEGKQLESRSLLLQVQIPPGRSAVEKGTGSRERRGHRENLCRRFALQTCLGVAAS
ncbi:hypothetical protein IE53DRAFT_265947 [Violaceomyces palustris]|uniref:Uncharacterized protein n=1 Tax=Violaceomyces palustris TaxID=1673888 RepID=A0ACD0NN05_9BASI|nr:hypothetical protein IE53DRAFT_265947 [Violaceomyces palustris]